jgi:hypothetical protein
MLGTILLCFAFVFLMLAACSVPAFGRLQHGWFGLALMVAAFIFGRVPLNF